MQNTFLGKLTTGCIDYKQNLKVKDFLEKHKIKIRKIVNQPSLIQTGIISNKTDKGWEITIFNDLIRNKTDLLFLFTTLSDIHIKENLLKPGSITPGELKSKIKHSLSFLKKELFKENEFEQIENVFNIYAKQTLNMYNLAFALDYLIKIKEFKNSSLEAFINYFFKTTFMDFHLFEPMALLSIMHLNNIKFQKGNGHRMLEYNIKKNFGSKPEEIAKTLAPAINKGYKVTYLDILSTMSQLSNELAKIILEINYQQG